MTVTMRVICGWVWVFGCIATLLSGLIATDAAPLAWLAYGPLCLLGIGTGCYLECRFRRMIESVPAVELLLDGENIPKSHLISELRGGICLSLVLLCIFTYAVLLSPIFLTIGAAILLGSILMMYFDRASTPFCSLITTERYMYSRVFEELELSTHKFQNVSDGTWYYLLNRKYRIFAIHDIRYPEGTLSQKLSVRVILATRTRSTISFHTQ